MATLRLLPLVLLSLPLAWGSRDALPAYITITGEETDGSPAKMRLPSTFVTQGTFSAVGAYESAEGSLCLVDKDFLLNFHKSKTDQQWIGLIYHAEDADHDLVEEETDNRGNRKPDGQDQHQIEKAKSLTEKVKELLLLGASALIIVAKNVRFTKEFDVTQVFSKPIVLFHGVKNVTKILQLISLRYNIFAKIQKNLPYYSAVGSIGTVTLWATCGRSTSGAYHEWQGVVCIGNGRFSSKAIDDYFIAMAWNLCLLLFICFLVYVMLSRNSMNGMADLENEVDNEGLARHVLSQMRIEIYRCRGRTSAKKSKKTFLRKQYSVKKFQNALDHCAICLDSFFPLQRLRILPCNHSFHLTCIDRWLLVQHTCPMCKFDILDHHRLKEAGSA